MSKFRKLTGSCDYKGLQDGSLLKSARRSVLEKNIHQIIVRNGNVNRPIQMDTSPGTHSSHGFLIGVVNYLPGVQSVHTNHAISAILTNGRLYCFNAHGIDSQSMRWLVNFLTTRGLGVTDFIQYSGPNLQALDTEGACTAFSSRFLKLHPNASMDQDAFNNYITREFTSYTLPELYMYLNSVKSIRNTGVRISNNAVNMNINNSASNMNINRPRRFKKI